MFQWLKSLFGGKKQEDQSTENTAGQSSNESTSDTGSEEGSEEQNQ